MNGHLSPTSMNPRTKKYDLWIGDGPHTLHMMACLVIGDNITGLYSLGINALGLIYNSVHSLITSWSNAIRNFG
jgi:hypothetical protein